MIRAAEIRTSTGTTYRPIAKLFPLEILSKTDFIQCAPETQKCSAEETQKGSTPPLRQGQLVAVSKSHPYEPPSTVQKVMQFLTGT